jgi:hypothetical protein
LGSNTETSHISGPALPSIYGVRQLNWQKYFHFDPTLAYPTNPTYFALWDRSSGGTGGPAPDGLVDLGGNIWVLPFPDSYDQIAVRDRLWAFWPYIPYELNGDNEVTRDNTGILPDYSSYAYLFDLQTDGNWHNATWGTVSVGALGGALARPYFYPNFSSAVYVFGPRGEYEDLFNTGSPGPYDAYYPGDTIGFDAGSITFRIW